ncbi:MAG: hypothetical protein ACFN1F_10240, partial [Segatella sp.]
YTIYSGNDPRFFSASHFDLLDLSLNYQAGKDWQIYLTGNNPRSQFQQNSFRRGTRLGKDGGLPAWIKIKLHSRRPENY